MWHATWKEYATGQSLNSKSSLYFQHQPLFSHTQTEQAKHRHTTLAHGFTTHFPWAPAAHPARSLQYIVWGIMYCLRHNVIHREDIYKNINETTGLSLKRCNEKIIFQLDSRKIFEFTYRYLWSICSKQSIHSPNPGLTSALWLMR